MAIEIFRLVTRSLNAGVKWADTHMDIDLAFVFAGPLLT